MDRLLLDTHSFVWWQSAPQQLTRRQAQAIEAVVRRPGRLFLSAISLWELAQLQAARRLTVRKPVDEWLDDLERLQVIEIIPISAKIAVAAAEFGPALSGDPADRLIVGTAYVYRATLVTGDERIRRSSLVPVL